MPMNDADIDSRRPEDELSLFFAIAARILVRSSEPKAFIDWAAYAGPDLLPSMAASVRAGSPGEFFRVLGRALRDAMPLPDRGFRPDPLPKPGRNEPCDCGSGRKYKHCCLPIEGLAPPFGEVNLLRYVLDSTPARRLSELPFSRVEPEAVWDTARQWLEEGDGKRAVALLEPWFAEGRDLTGCLEPMFDLLMDCYLRGGNERKRKNLLERVLARGDRALRSAALQRRTAMLADRGTLEEAWASFREAQREDPGSPGLAHLEVVLLAGQGEYTRAGERATFWIASLGRRRDPNLAELISWLREVAADPRSAMAAMSREVSPGIGRLKELLDRAPAPAVRHRFEPMEGSTGPVTPDPALARAEARWRKAFPQVKPWLTATQHGDPSAWDDAQRWLAMLTSTPDLWQSFDVLDDLAMALDALPTLDNGEDLLEPVLERGVGLLRLNLERCPVPDARFEWGWVENRPALRLAAHLVFRRYRAGDWERFVQLAEWILTLNPADNHGLRDPLSRAYLELDAPERVLELSARYPDDGTTLSMNAVLAQWRSRAKGDALKTLAHEAPRCSEAVRMLLAENPKPPKLSGQGITLGGKDEAWLYRIECRELWERDGALAWLREAWKAARPRSSR